MLRSNAELWAVMLGLMVPIVAGTLTGLDEAFVAVIVLVAAGVRRGARKRGSLPVVKFSQQALCPLDKPDSAVRIHCVARSNFDRDERRLYGAGDDRSARRAA